MSEEIPDTGNNYITAAVLIGVKCLVFRSNVALIGAKFQVSLSNVVWMGLQIYCK